MCAHHAERSDVAVWHAVTGFFLHLCEHVADNLWWIVGSLLRARYINSDITQLWPAHGMVHVVFAKVVFGQVGDVGLLDVGNVAWTE
jgi:hypothetical protein